MPLRVNLDAMIPREDFDVENETTSATRLVSSFTVSEFEPNKTTLVLLRKPDFQRETNSWEPDKVVALIKSYLEGELIPTVILWRSNRSPNIFTIDGAHRLSALIAWVHDDYGDRSRSMHFFDNFIPPEQRRAAEITRQMIDNEIGTYEQLKIAPAHPNTVTPYRLRLAQNLSLHKVDLQWVEGNADKAERSFKTINQQGVQIDPIEFRMIEDRRKPIALATRALIRAGTGHKYWSGFTETRQHEIEMLAKEIHTAFLTPELETPIRTDDLPMGGRSYSAESVKLTFNFVEFANRDRRKEQSLTGLNEQGEDTTGEATVEHLRSMWSVVSMMAGNRPESLGLHRLVYYYSATGVMQPAAVLAAAKFACDLDTNKDLIRFTANRNRFEEFLVSHKYFINQIVQKRGAGERGLAQILDMYNIVLNGVADQLSDEKIIAKLDNNEQLRRILSVLTEDDLEHGRNFSSRIKTAAILKEKLTLSMRCEICQARIDQRSVSFDHKTRKQDGGQGALDNAALTHPFCNTGYKESLNAKKIKTVLASL